MRRILSLAFVAAACIAAMMLTGASEQEEARTYRVDALFYNAAHLIPGQTVKIAGAEVGSVKDVRLTKDRRARVQMEVDKRFAPFHADARCTIRPQSLIGEKFVQCVPGTPNAAELKSQNGEAPTVPVKSNRTPVDLDLVFDSLRMPYRERLELIINELGTGLAGRPEELNQAIRLANPALEETNRVLEILDSDRARLGKLIDASDTVIAELAGKKGEVQDFIDRAGGVADEVASKRGDVDLAIHRLPPLLAELEPAATDLSTLSREARPILADLRESAPGVRALAADLDPLNDAARPALVRLADMSRTGRSAVRAANPIADLLRPVADKLPGVTGPTLALLNDMRGRGVVEGLQNFTYFATLATARFDQYSHILPSYQIGGLCNVFATGNEPVDGCDAHFAGANLDTKSKTTEKKAKHKKKKRRKRRRGRDRGHETGQGQAAPPETSAPAAPVPSIPGVPSVPSVPTPAPGVPQTPDAVDDLLDFLLGS